MNNPTSKNPEVRNEVVNSTISWLHGIENEERRKLVNALKRTKDVLNNPNNPKLLLSKRQYIDKPLMPIIVLGQRHGKPRFSLEYLPKEVILNTKDYLYPNEALIVSEKTKIERSNYAHRLKLAFMFIAGKVGVRHNKEFRYSTDGEHFTKSYRSIADVPQGEETISHSQALEIIEADAKLHPNIYQQPAFGAAQTKVFRVSYPNSQNETNKCSWIVISKKLESLENGYTKNSTEKKAYFQCKELYQDSNTIRANKDYKLVWPTNQVKSLLYLLELCKELILQQYAKTLGDGNHKYAIIYEKNTTRDYQENLLYKALVCQGTDKTDASKLACQVINDIWTEEDNTKTNQAKALTCLSLQDCSLLIHLIKTQTGQEY